MLATTQQLFYQAIFDKDVHLDFIASENAKDRLHIYRRNIFETLRHCLATTFPGVWILLGETCANSVAHTFIQKQHLTHHHCLHEWGLDFPAFLGQVSELKMLPYIEDYALFEWHKHLAYYATDTNSMFCMTSAFALQDIQEIVNNPDADAIDLKKEATMVIVVKINDEVFSIFRRIT